MQTALLLVTAFASAAAVAYYGVYASERFHTLFFLLRGSGPVLAYSLCYGLLGLLLFLLLKESVWQLTPNNTVIGSDWLKAAGTGASVKAVSDVNLFNIRSSGTTLPVGIKTFTQPLDQFFDGKFNEAGYERSVRFLKPFYDKYKDKVPAIQGFKDSIVIQLKRFHPDQKKVAAFVTADGFVKTTETDEVLSLVLNEFGGTIFKRIFDNLNYSAD